MLAKRQKPRSSASFRLTRLTRPRRVSLLGCTGSIGTNTLNIIRENPKAFKVVSLACGNSIELLKSQIEEFRPEAVSVGSQEKLLALRLLLPKNLKTKIQMEVGREGHRKIISDTRPDVVISAMSGTHGLLATMQAVRQGVSILGIANKEILVMAGSFILNLLKKSKTKLIPVDSEHSAIFQALMGNDPKFVRKIILTGSGGPFRNRPLSTFASITKEEALKHPNWLMGAKITIDSATMMNKGLEFIEAIRLFNFPTEKIQILIHPESILHSMVEYVDGSFIAQLGISDMRIPISLALAYPNRLELELPKSLDLAALQSLQFQEPDFEKFPCLRVAIESEAMGKEGPIILNAANEKAVERFLTDEIAFVEIPILVETALHFFKGSKVTSLDAVIELDDKVKRWAENWRSQMKYSRQLSQAF